MKQTRLVFLLVSAIVVAQSQVILAAGHKLAVGASAASGGSNPITFSPSEFSYTYINSSRDREFVVGLAPGIGYAVRFNPYRTVSVSLGGIAAISNTLYAGIYSGFGWEIWCPSTWICMNFDYRTSTALYSHKTRISGLSTVSLGGTLWTN
ncbi:MAG: hypothetical protein RI953_438 [Pseudomonadota bacterium]|jgi:hypothetical protein